MVETSVEASDDGECFEEPRTVLECVGTLQSPNRILETNRVPEKEMQIDTVVRRSLGVFDEAAMLLWLKVGAAALAAPEAARAQPHKEAAFKLLIAPYRAAPPDFGASAAAALVEDLVLAGEHGATLAAECCAVAAQAHDDARASLAGDVLRELSRVVEGSAQDETEGGTAALGKSTKCVACFVEQLALKSPSAAVAHLATLKAHLSSRSSASLEIG